MIERILEDPPGKLFKKRFFGILNVCDLSNSKLF
jgi:hypothetical protein